MPALDPLTDFVQLPVDGTGKKTGFLKVGDLYVAASLGINPDTGEMYGEASGTRMPVIDRFTDGEVLSEQAGAGAVLTFTFAADVECAVVESYGADLVSRADPFGGTPDVDTGIPCRSEIPVWLHVVTDEVKVFAPAGAAVNVWGFRQ